MDAATINDRVYARAPKTPGAGAQAVDRGGSLVAGSRRFTRRPGLLARLVAPRFTGLLDRIDRALDSGTIHGTLPDGTRVTLGGRAPGFECEVQLHSWLALVRLASNGSVGWYQAWAAGEWSSPDPVPLFALFMHHAARLGDVARAKGPYRAALNIAHLFNRNTLAGSRRNIAAHYDLGNDFYAAWLGGSMAYSSGWFGTIDEPSSAQQMLDALDFAQLAKVTRIVRRVAPKPGDRVLEIGCGWGLQALTLADRGVAVEAISLSDEQLAFCRERLATEGGKKDVAFHKRDYRDVRGQYDAVVSVEMVEALGRENWPVFLDSVARALKPGGRAALQFISMRDDLFDAYAASADFIQACVFPGGMLIRTSEFRRLAEARGLVWTDQVDFGLDYAQTLKLWRANFDRAVAAGSLPQGFDKPFLDLWRYYLMYCEGGFRGGGIDVHQVTLIKGD